MPPKLKKVFRPGETKTLTLDITNRATERQPIHFELKNVPDDWRVVLEHEDLVLDGGARQELTLSIQAPDKIEKDKVGMRLLSIPEFEPGKKQEIWILAKLRPTRKQLKEAKNGGLFSRSKDEDETEDEAEEEATDRPVSVVRTGPARDRPDPEDVVEFRYAPGITAGGFYHATHIAVGGGTVLKLREQVQLLCRLCSARNICYEGKFHRYMDWETFLESDHCFIEAGDFD